MLKTLFSVSHSGAVPAAAVAFLIHLNICEPATSPIMARHQNTMNQTSPYQAPAFFANSNCTKAPNMLRTSPTFAFQTIPYTSTPNLEPAVPILMPQGRLHAAFLLQTFLKRT